MKQSNKRRIQEMAKYLNRVPNTWNLFPLTLFLSFVWWSVKPFSLPSQFLRIWSTPSNYATDPDTQSRSIALPCCIRKCKGLGFPKPIIVLVLTSASQVAITNKCCINPIQKHSASGINWTTSYFVKHICCCIKHKQLFHSRRKAGNRFTLFLLHTTMISQMFMHSLNFCVLGINQSRFTFSLQSNLVIQVMPET